MLKLNQLLGLVENKSSQITALLRAYIAFFTDKQGAFRGEKKTYEPKQGTFDVPANRFNTKVTTTVDEKLWYAIEYLANQVQDELNVEATNASGITAELKVGNVSYGEFTSLELLRLKNILFREELRQMIYKIPVRSDAKDWERADQDYPDQNVYKNPTLTYEEKTTHKEDKILEDPNVSAAIAAGKTINYSPVKVTLTTSEVVGEGTHTKYSGEWTHEKRAKALNKLQEFKDATLIALQEANQAEIVESVLPMKQILQSILLQDKS